VNSDWGDDFHDDPFGSEPASDDPFANSGPRGDDDQDPLDPFAIPTTTTPSSTGTAGVAQSPRIHLPRIPRWLVVAAGTVLVVALVGPRLFSGGGEPDWDRLTRSIVLIFSPDCGWAGSGTVVLDGDHVLTNAHVTVDDAGRPCDLEIYAADSPDLDPEWIANAVVVGETIDRVHDLAVIRLVDDRGRPTTAEGRPAIQVRDQELALGGRLKVLGYPGMGGIKITITPGEQAGWWTGEGDGWEGDFYKTSAKMGAGVSGGAAFSVATGEFIGVPTGASSSEDPTDSGDILGLIRPSSYAVPLLERAEELSND